MLSLATKTDRTLFFDFLPLDLGKIRGMRTKLQLYTVPGQVYYNSTRQLVLKGADGIVFVADSQDFAIDANLESLQNLEDNLKRQGIRIREIPLVMQYNKRDLPNAMTLEQLDAEVNKLGSQRFESVATTGIGVEETLKGITQLVLAHLVKKYGLQGAEPHERDIQILNVATPSPEAADSLWDDEDPFDHGTPPFEAQRVTLVSPTPYGEPEFELDEFDDESLPLVATELVNASGPLQPIVEGNPFEEVTDYYGATSDHLPDSIEVPPASVEIPIPLGILESLPVLGESHGRRTADEDHERRANDGLVREVTIPLNLSIEELRQHRRLRLKITLDVNLLR
jgi:mutual gliding-motility protein MglA